MENTSKTQKGLFIMIGLIFLGLMLPQAARTFRSYERTVSVKGLCEKEVKADKVIWPVVYKVVGNDMANVYGQIEAQKTTILDYLKKGGLTDEEISVSVPSISDKFTAEYGDNNRTYRFVATCTITVCSENVDAVLGLMKGQSELFSKGISFSNNEWETKPYFSFEGLNDIKPEMIEEATKNARAAAEKFAKDSDSKLGKIKTANQGQFSIMDRDSNTPQEKKVRVVTSIEYYLSK
ncbi:MAG: SIMPL domain-containing protein [Bacteroidales bacterium]|nr:SIMPL domain-containing protein [Bacteroidales bacterium]